MIDNSVIQIQDVSDNSLRQIAQSITHMAISYTVDGASQITIELVDENLEMWNNGYFRVNTTYLINIGSRGYYEKYMVASHEISAGEGDYFKIKIELRDHYIQKMKTDRKPEAYRSTTGYEFAKKVAAAFGLQFLGEQPVGVKTTTIKVKQDKHKESVYEVLIKAAKDLQYLCFVAYAIPEGQTVAVPTLVFASPYWLLGRWGLEQTPAYTFTTYAGKKETRPLYFIPLKYPNDEKLNFFLTQVPDMRRSMDSPKESEGKASLWVGSEYEKGIGSAYNIRAGMTVCVYGITGFDETAYLITSVEYAYSEPEPVQIAFATVEKMAPEDKKKINQKVQEVTVIGGGSSNSVVP